MDIWLVKCSLLLDELIVFQIYNFTKYSFNDLIQKI